MIQTGQTIEPNDFYRVSLQTTKSNSGTFAEETILSGTLPAGILTMGRWVRVRCLFKALNRANAGVDGSWNLMLTLGSTVIATLSAGGLNPSQPGVLEGVIRYHGSNSERGSLSLVLGGSNASVNYAEGSATENLANALTVKLSVSGSLGAYETSHCTIELL